MTGKKFSNRKVNRHDFFSIFKKNSWILLLATILFLILIPFSTAGLDGNSIFDIEVTHEQMKFRFMHEDIVLAVSACAVLLGILCGLFLFRFLQNKKDTTVLFSLGITRKRLFMNRCIAGILFIVLPIAISMLVSLWLNKSALGLYTGAVRNCIYIICGLSITAIISFLITIIASCAAGTLAEAFIYTVSVLVTPSVLGYGVNLLMKLLMWGNARGVLNYSATDYISQDLPGKISAFNPIVFFNSDLKESSIFYRPLESPTPPDIHIGSLICWAAVSIILAAAAYWALKCRNAETAGISGTNKIFSEIVIWLTGFLAFTGVFVILYDFGETAAWILGIAVFGLVHLFWRKSIFTYAVTTKKMISSAFFQMVFVIALLLVLKHSESVYTRYILETKEMVQAEVSYPGTPNYLFGEASGSSTENGYYIESSIESTDIEEIEQIKKLQQMFVDSGKQEMEPNSEDFSRTVVPYDVRFSYKDSSGKEYIWYYDRASLQQLESMLKIDNFESVRNGNAGTVSGELEESDAVIWSRQAYQYGQVYLADAFYQEKYELLLSEEQRGELLQALAEDVKIQDISDRYFPERQGEAVLMFSQNGEEDKDSFRYHLNNVFVYITEEFTNTLKFMEQNDLLSLFENNWEIESITLQKFNPYEGINDLNYPMSMYFMSYSAESLDGFIVKKDFQNPNTITDSEKIRELSGGLRNSYFMSGGGYLAAVKIKGDEGYTYMFIPEKEVPDFIKK